MLNAGYDLVQPVMLLMLGIAMNVMLVMKVMLAMLWMLMIQVVQNCIPDGKGR